MEYPPIVGAKGVHDSAEHRQHFIEVVAVEHNRIGLACELWKVAAGNVLRVFELEVRRFYYYSHDAFSCLLLQHIARFHGTRP